MGGGAKVGVLSLQGAFRRHADALVDCGAHPVAVASVDDLTSVDALVIPGGESTTIDKLLRWAGMAEPLRERLEAGMPAFGTCAGMILLASEVLDGRPDQTCLAAIDIAVRRNAFGRQIDSFECGLEVDGLGGEPFAAMFIRAPAVERVGEGVEVLSRIGGDRIVMCRQDAVLVAAFHPELADDRRIHELFLSGF